MESNNPPQEQKEILQKKEEVSQEPQKREEISKYQFKKDSYKSSETAYSEEDNTIDNNIETNTNKEKKKFL